MSNGPRGTKPGVDPDSVETLPPDGLPSDTAFNLEKQGGEPVPTLRTGN